MNKKVILSLAVVAGATLFSGCTSDGSVTAVDPKATQVMNASQISPQEWSQAADKLINSLLSSNVLDRAPELPAVMAISRIVNNTQMMIDTDSLTKKIRVALNQSGKVLTTTTVGLGGKAEDQLAKESSEFNQFMSGQKQQTKMPHYTLSGKIIEDRIKQDNKTQVTYTFQLSLTTVTDGLAVWEGEEQLSKVAQRSSVGW